MITALVLALTLGGLLKLVLILALVGLVVWLITAYIPMPPIFKTIIYVVVAIVLILWLIGMIDGAGMGLEIAGDQPLRQRPGHEPMQVYTVEEAKALCDAHAAVARSLMESVARGTMEMLQR